MHDYFCIMSPWIRSRLDKPKWKKACSICGELVNGEFYFDGNKIAHAGCVEKRMQDFMDGKISSEDMDKPETELNEQTKKDETKDEVCIYLSQIRDDVETICANIEALYSYIRKEVVPLLKK